MSPEVFAVLSPNERLAPLNYAIENSRFKKIIGITFKCNLARLGVLTSFDDNRTLQSVPMILKTFRFSLQKHPRNLHPQPCPPNTGTTTTGLRSVSWLFCLVEGDMDIFMDLWMLKSKVADFDMDRYQGKWKRNMN